MQGAAGARRAGAEPGRGQCAESSGRSRWQCRLETRGEAGIEGPRRESHAEGALRARCARVALLDCGPGCGAEPVRCLEYDRREAPGASRCRAPGVRVPGAARRRERGSEELRGAGRWACGCRATRAAMLGAGRAVPRRGAVRGAGRADSWSGAKHQGAPRGAYPKRAPVVAGKGQGGAARLLARRGEKGCAPSLLPPAPAHLL